MIKRILKLIIAVVVMLAVVWTPPVLADIEVLRPNGAGSETSITYQYPDSGSHWDKVDEEIPDDSTYVNAGYSDTWQRDLYALPAHTGSGTINSVTVYARLKSDATGNYGKISIRTNGVTYDTSAYALNSSWATKSNEWTTNPQTGAAWTWDEIDALEAGISLYGESGGPLRSILKGQKVLMTDGSQKNIEDVQIGDEVLSFNINSEKIEKDKVVEIRRGSHNDYLVFNGILKTSLEHMIWASGDFKEAKDIKIGDFLLNSDGQEVEVTKIEYIQENVETYDLIVEKNHNYFASNYLVHNAFSTYCTQVYVEVDYTPTSAAAPAPGMTSTNYAIKADSINVGGHHQTSNNYKMSDTIGEIATGISSSTNYKLKAGYQQMVSESYLSISSPSDVVMSPSIPGLSGGTATGEAEWTVITDNPAGYSLMIEASTSPAMQGQTQGDSFADYTEVSSGIPDYDWSVADSTAEFGFTPEGNDIVQKFKDNGSDSCNTGSNDSADKCWYHFSTSQETVCNSYSANHPSGTSTTIKFRAQLYNADGVPNNEAGVLIEDTYQATITVTALAN